MKKIFLLLLLYYLPLVATQKVETVDLLPGDTNCPEGGVAIFVGEDIDENEHIEGSEIQSSTYVCRGKDGKASKLVVSEEPAGENCASGGSKIENCFDANGNDTFEDSEISVYYVCNGEQGLQGEQGRQGVAGTDGMDGSDGAKGERGDKGEQGDQGPTGEPGAAGPDGFDSLVSIVDEAAGDQCANGGKKFMSGLDKDRNGVLDESEVKNSYYICNGENAVEASEAASSSGCSVTIF